MALGLRKLPPLKALIAFEVSARNLSFAEAARELNVTRVAVSRQVRQLELFLGLELFARGQSSIKLTRTGRRLARTVNQGFQSILDEIEAIENTKEDNLITIATTSGVSTYLLMPNIGRYRRINSKVDFRLLVSQDLINLVQSDVDIAIRYGSGNWPGTKSVLLQRQQIMPLCSPAFLNKFGPFDALEDLANVPLLDFESAVDASSLWPNFFRDKGLVLGNNIRMSSYDSYVNLVQAVLDGQGIGLLGPPLMQQFTDSSVLVPALDTALLPQNGYYMCHPEAAAPTQTVTDFSNWLMSELSIPSQLDSDNR